MKTFRILLPVILGSLLIHSCRTRSGEEKNKEVEVLPENIVELSAEQSRVAGIAFGAIEQRTLSSTLKVNGILTVRPRNLASVCAPFGGFVKATDLVEGCPVEKGQVLAVLENPEFIELQQNYLEAKSKLEYAEGEYTRHKELYQEDVYSAKNFQEVTSLYKSLKTEVSALGQKLALIGIDGEHLRDENITSTVAVFSPITGFVKAVNVNLGKFVSPTDVLFEIVNTADLVVELSMFEKDITRVTVGQPLRFHLPHEVTAIYSAVVTQVGKAIADDKTVKVYASVPGSSSHLLPGMYVSGWIETASCPVTSVPSEAIVQFDDKYYIFLFEKDKEENGKPFTEFRMVEVTPRLTDNGFTEIIIPENVDVKQARVVVRGAYNLMAAKKNAGEMAC